MNNDIRKVIENTAASLGITENKVTKVVENVFNFLSNSMNKVEFAKYRLPLFGSFNVIPSRYERYKIRRSNKKLNNNSTNDKQNQ